MALLLNMDRQDAANEYQRVDSKKRRPIPGLKSDVKALIDEADEFLDANFSTYNQTIPPAQRTLYSPKQKNRALLIALRRRVRGK